MFSTRIISLNNINDTTKAEGTFQCSKILSLKSNNTISIANIAPADIAVSERCIKKSLQQANVTIGVPIVNTVDIPLNVLYFATIFILIPRCVRFLLFSTYNILYSRNCLLDNTLNIIYFFFNFLFKAFYLLFKLRIL